MNFTTLFCGIILSPKHRRRSGWNSGGRIASAEGGLVPRGVVYGEGSPFRSRLGGLRERCQLPQRGPGQSPGRKRILAYFEGHRTLFLYLYGKIGGGTICISVPLLQTLGGPVPRVPPMIYAHTSASLWRCCDSVAYYECHDWLQVQRSEESQINIMGNVNQPFLSTGRYDVFFISTPPTFKLQLHVSGQPSVRVFRYLLFTRLPR